MIFLEYLYIISFLSDNYSLNFHIPGRFGRISRHFRGARFKIFPNHGCITSFKLLGEEMRYLLRAEGEWISSFRQNIYPCFMPASYPIVFCIRLWHWPKGLIISNGPCTLFCFSNLVRPLFVPILYGSLSILYHSLHACIPARMFKVSHPILAFLFIVG